MELKRCLCLRDIPLFAGVELASFKPFCLAATKRYIRRGEILFHQGHEVDSVYLVKQGSFKMVRLTEEGQEVILQIIIQGEITPRPLRLLPGPPAPAARRRQRAAAVRDR